MEEQNLNREQPDMTCSVNVAAASEEMSNDESQSGSLYGKFKDAESLLNGYKELEKEFTKKSQLLSELQKSNDSDNTARVPLYKTENWQSKIDTELSSKQYVSDFAVDIARTIMQDEELACMPNCLDLAYNKVLANNYKSESEIAKSKEFLEKYIYTNEEIRTKILDEYLAGLKKNTTPPIMLNKAGESVGVISPTKARNLSEARKLVEQLFNK